METNKNELKEIVINDRFKFIDTSEKDSFILIHNLSYSFISPTFSQYNKDIKFISLFLNIYRNLTALEFTSFKELINNDLFFEMLDYSKEEYLNLRRYLIDFNTIDEVRIFDKYKSFIFIIEGFSMLDNKLLVKCRNNSRKYNLCIDLNTLLSNELFEKVKDIILRKHNIVNNLDDEIGFIYDIVLFYYVIEFYNI